MPDFERLKSEQAMNEEKVVEFYKASFKLPTSYETENLSADGGGGGGGGGSGYEHDPGNAIHQRCNYKR